MEAFEDTAPIEELIRRIGEGDLGSFEEFYDKFSGLVHATAMRVLNDAEDAKDATQDAFFMLWEKAPLYSPERGKPLTWLMTITRNKAIDRLRARQRRTRLQDEVERATVEDSHIENDSFDELDHHEQGAILRQAVGKLSDEQREAIELAYFSNLTQQEIADRLKEPIGTVKARIRRGLMRLKKLVESKVC